MQERQEHLLKILFILIWVLALTHIAAEYFYLYWTLWWFDLVTHFLGGMWLGLAALWLWYFSGYLGKRVPGGRALLVAVAAGLCLGLAWELYEYLVWQWSGNSLPPNYVSDTILDLVMDVVGACAGYNLFRILELRAERRGASYE